MDLLLGNFRSVLGGQNHRVQAEGLSVLIVLHGNLGLSVGTQVGQSAVLADFGQFSCQLVSQGDGIGHILLGLAAGIAEHHSLISGADGVDVLIGHGVFLGLQSLVHAHGDVGGLLVNGRDYRAGLGVKAEFSSGVADLGHSIPDNLRNIDVGLGGDLSHDHHHAGGSAGLAGHTAHGILGHQSVQDGV